MRKAVTWIVLLVTLAVMSASGSALAKASSEALTLTGPTTTISEGYFNLEVTHAQNPHDILIEQGSDATFSSVSAEFRPMGSFEQISLSGFDDGTYYFRAREGDRVSNVVEVTVRHYPLWQAFSLFGLGAVIFILLVKTIIRYHLRSDSTVKNTGDSNG